MAWFQIALTEDEQRVVNAERDSHPDAHVRRKMLVLWLLHHGDTRERAATVTGLGRATVQRYVRAYKDGGLDGLRRWGVVGPVSDVAAHADLVRASLTADPVRTTAEAADRIEQLTGAAKRPRPACSWPGSGSPTSASGRSRSRPKNSRRARRHAA